ncbi:MAG: hypothetical protein AAF366_21515 [Pseudomonadota bacterium]
MRPVLLLATALTLPGCAAVTVAGAATGAAATVGTTAVRGAVGAGRLVVGGTARGVRALTSSENGFEAGTLVCLDEDGEPYAAAIEQNGQTICPDPV